MDDLTSKSMSRNSMLFGAVFIIVMLFGDFWMKEDIRFIASGISLTISHFYRIGASIMKKLEER